MEKLVLRLKVPRLKDPKKIGFSFILLAFALALTAILPIKYSLNLAKSQEHIVIFNGEGFIPLEITIQKGDIVKFVNNTDKQFWPASNYHPTHGIYPEFDPKKSIETSETWYFRFDQIGRWEYHDHLSPKYQAVVNVQGPKNYNTFKYESCNDSYPVKCWIEQINLVLNHQSLEEAFEKFSNLYDQEAKFPSMCHDVAHFLGEAAYQNFVKTNQFNWTPKTAYCGYGFYHGFMEALIRDNQNFTLAQQFCDSANSKLSSDIANPRSRYACYHGLGHAIFDSQDQTIWGKEEEMIKSALSFCETVTSGEDPILLKECATGVFNALGISYHNNEFNLTFDKNNPFRACQREPKLYSLACFAQVPGSVVFINQLDLSKALDLLEQIKDDEAAQTAVFGVVSGIFARQDIQDPKHQKIVEACHKTQQRLRLSCIRGVAGGIYEWGKPDQEYVDIIEFCDSDYLYADEKEGCFKFILPLLDTLYSFEKINQICENLDNKYKQYCRLN